jgi:transcription antitermination factor NusG
MNEYTVGDTVRITGSTMTGNVGTVVHLDTDKQKYLVRIDAVTQNWFGADALEPFKKD